LTLTALGFFDWSWRAPTEEALEPAEESAGFAGGLYFGLGNTDFDIARSSGTAFAPFTVVVAGFAVTTPFATGALGVVTTLAPIFTRGGVGRAAFAASRLEGGRCVGVWFGERLRFPAFGRAVYLLGRQDIEFGFFIWGG
jgi:hypothetical protein